MIRFRELDTTKLSHRRRLIDSFLNSIVLYDDRMIFTGNYKDSTKTITFAEIEAAGLSSDLTASLGPARYGIKGSWFCGFWDGNPYLLVV